MKGYEWTDRLIERQTHGKKDEATDTYLKQRFDEPTKRQTKHLLLIYILQVSLASFVNGVSLMEETFFPLASIILQKQQRARNNNDDATTTY